MTSYATADDVAAEMGKGFDEFDTYSVNRWLSHASAIMRRAVPSLQERIDDGRLEPEIANAVCAAMVVRKMRNRLALRSSTTGPYAADYPDDGSLVLMPAEEARLRAPRVGPRAGTVRVGAPLYQDAVHGWVPCR